MSDDNSWSRPMRDTFLNHLRKTGNVSASAIQAGSSRSSAYRLRKRDEEFAAEWKDALDGFLDALEAELFRRALKGSLKPVFYGGKKSGSMRSYNDSLGMFLLRARRPDVFAERGAAGAQDAESAPPGPLPRDILERRLEALSEEAKRENDARETDA